MDGEGHGPLIARLRDALGAARVSIDKSEREALARDALGSERGFDERAAPVALPAVVVRPDATEQVAAVLRIANELRVAVLPYGGGTGLMGGARSVADGIVVDMAKMARVRDVDVASGWAWVEAGAVLHAVDAQLEPYGVMLGHDPWTVSVATVGGTISTNGLGFLGGKYGSMGRQVLAVEAVLADGSVFATRPARPHSAGIDLDHLLVGAEGTLGIVTAAALRVFPLPEARELLGFRFPTFERGFEALLAMRAIALAPALLDYGERTPPARAAGWEAEPPTLYLGFEGFREEAAAQGDRASGICRAHGAAALEPALVETFWTTRHDIAEGFARRRAAQRREATPRARRGPGRSFDYVHVALPASRVLEYRAAVTDFVPSMGVDVVETGLWVDPGLFSLVLSCEGGTQDESNARMAAAVDRCLRLAHNAGGSMEYCHGVGVRLAHLMREEHGRGLDVMRALKRAVDPNGVLNPGKLALQ